jgi:tetratricopeptide (TPR) repeat protein
LALVMLVAATFSLPAESDEGKEEAKVHFTEGEKLFDQGRYAEAAREFDAAYKLAPHPQVLYNIATCYEESGDIPAAVVAYRRYVAEAEDTGEVTSIKQKLAEMEKLIGEVRIGCALSPCQVRVDGEDRGSAPLSAVLSPGSHELEAVYNGHVVEKSEVEVEMGQKDSVTMALDVDPADYADIVRREAAPEKTEEERIETAAPEEDEGVTLGAGFWIASGVAVAAGATTAVFGALTLKDEEDFEDAGRLDEDIQARGERDRLVTNVMIGVTAAAGATALAFAIHDIWFGDDEEQAEPDPDADVAIAPGPGLGLAVSGVF